LQLECHLYRHNGDLSASLREAGLESDAWQTNPFRARSENNERSRL